ncbi:MAG TPA: non-canonical purine NTP pyrophosphatase, RdgB/HAM1 family [Candidatus Omnitrophica bacterium]|nr:non-canonical purine NTP pyrophosphatase, RdgB/HAM1 family [Candidatus Omnitrophota bacterium]HCI45585.1 non-canonical purine NTP pyrophosphatase, RdgB/HAM1 family [Candidatus Omnitrophota bacterium]
MHELIIATTNAGKLREIRELLKGLDVKITSLSDYPDAPGVEEDGKNFVQNALKKAATIALYTGKLTLGEDSGLEVKALGNKPGIYSARFAGSGATDKKNNAKLLRSLRGVSFKKRQARYRCFAALVDGKGVIDVVSGSCAGLIALKGKGSNGFGYDPLFFIPRYNKTFGELDPSVKAEISHRARAFRKVRRVLEKYLECRARGMGQGTRNKSLAPCSLLLDPVRIFPSISSRSLL